MLTLVWRATALDDLEQVTSYITERDRGAAERLQAAIEACAERLSAPAQARERRL